MARPRDKRPLQENERFLSRCAKEEEKLRLTVAVQLQKDMKRLYEEELHCDLKVKIKSSVINIHKFVLNARSEEILRRMREIAIATEDGVLTLPDWVNENDFKKGVRRLYTTMEKDLDDFIINSEDLDTNLALVMDVLSVLTKFETDHGQINGAQENDITSDIDRFTEKISEFKSASTSSISELENINEETDFESVANDNNLVSKEAFVGSGNESDIESKERTSDDISDFDQTTKASSVDSNSNSTAVTGKDDSDKLSESLEKGDNYLPDLIKMTYDLSLPHKPCDCLGEALLRGHLKELNHDCVISVSGAHFKVNKCILAVRSSYFSAMLSGSWAESDAQEINLENVSPPTMEQILLYLYGGVIDIDVCASLGELVMVCDMYGMEGLNNILTYNLKKTYCHFFHKPCSGCETGVPEALVSAVTFNLSELKDKCISWINNNLGKVWRTKSFATLPPEILDMCCNAAIKDLNINCVLETMLECQKLNRNILRLKWCEPVLSAITRLMDASIEFTGRNFLSLLNSPKFGDIDHSLAYRMSLLEEIFDMVIKSLPTAGVCQVFQRLHELSEVTKREDINLVWSEEFCQFISSLYKMCESFMKLHIHQVAHTKDWDVLNKETQDSLIQSANYVCIVGLSKDRKAPPKLTSMTKDKKTSTEAIKSLREVKHITKSRTSTKTEKYSASTKSKVTTKTTTSSSSTGSRPSSASQRETLVRPKESLTKGSNLRKNPGSYSSRSSIGPKLSVPTRSRSRASSCNTDEEEVKEISEKGDNHTQKEDTSSQDGHRGQCLPLDIHCSYDIGSDFGLEGALSSVVVNRFESEQINDASQVLVTKSDYPYDQMPNEEVLDVALPEPKVFHVQLDPVLVIDFVCPDN